jgi:long-chain fatty acid transport protein
LLLASTATQALGGGIWLYEQGMPDLGMANAGRAALAENAATAAGNPAGLTRLKQSQVLAGIQPMFLDVKFDKDASTFGGGDGKNAGAFIPGGSFYYAHNTSPRLKLGFATASTFGAGLDHSGQWAGRYYVTEVYFLTAKAGPSVGYRINDNWSVGAHAFAMYADLSQKAAINNAALDPGVGDGKLRFKDYDLGYGGQLGVLFSPYDSTRFGLTYTSEVDLQFKDEVTLKNLGPTLSALTSLIEIKDVKLKMNIPQEVMFSAYHDLNDKVELVANLGWQDWSDFGQYLAQIQSTSTVKLEKDRNFRDTWHTAIGVRYAFRPNWKVLTGVAYDSSPVKTRDRTPDMPLDRQWRIGIGLQHEYRKDLSLGVAYEYVNMGDADIDRAGGALTGSLKGSYSPYAIHIANVTMNWRF